MTNMHYFILTIAVVLPAVLIFSPILSTPIVRYSKIMTIFIISILATSYAVINIQAIGLNTLSYIDEFVVTSVSQSFDTLILSSAFALNLLVLRILVAPISSELMAYASNILTTPMQHNYSVVFYHIVLNYVLVMTYSILIITNVNIYDLLAYLNTPVSYIQTIVFDCWDVFTTTKLYYLLGLGKYLLLRIIIIHAALMFISYYCWCICLNNKGPLSLYFKLLQLLRIFIFLRLSFYIGLRMLFRSLFISFQY